MKNHELCPTGSQAFPEANAIHVPIVDVIEEVKEVVATTIMVPQACRIVEQQKWTSP